MGAPSTFGLHRLGLRQGALGAECMSHEETPDMGPSNTQQQQTGMRPWQAASRGTTHGARTSRTITSLLSNGGRQGDGGGGISSITTHLRDPTQGVANPLKG